MRILVSGGAGFIGSHLVERLVKEGHEVTVIDNLSNGSLENLKHVKQKIKLIIEDVSTISARNNLTPEVIYALHCYPRSLSFSNPQKDVRVNVIGTVNLLELAKKSKAKIIFASNSGIYGEHEKLPIDETFSDNPVTPYDLDKQIIEKYLKLYHKTFAVSYVIFRFATVYGPRQNVTSQWKPVVKQFLNQVLRGETVTIDGDGTQTRDFIYVTDLVDALLKALDCEKAVGETMILSIGTETSINRLFKTVCKVTGKNASHVFGPRRLDDIDRMVYSNGKAQKILGWQPQYSLEAGLKEMLELKN